MACPPSLQRWAPGPGAGGHDRDDSGQMPGTVCSAGRDRSYTTKAGPLAVADKFHRPADLQRCRWEDLTLEPAVLIYESSRRVSGGQPVHAPPTGGLSQLAPARSFQSDGPPQPEIAGPLSMDTLYPAEHTGQGIETGPPVLLRELMMQVWNWFNDGP